MIHGWYERAIILEGTLGPKLASVRALANASVLVPALVGPVLAQGGPYFHRGPFGPGPWLWFAGAAMLLRLVLVVVLGVVVWRLLTSRGGTHAPDAALQILRERYAKGEINEEEYRKRVATLT